MKLCLCKTDWLGYKGFTNGNEYQFEKNELNGLYRVWKGDGEFHWFNETDMNDWFKIY